MSAIDDILAKKPETFDEASQNTVDQLISRQNSRMVNPGLSPAVQGRNTVQTIPRVVDASKPLGFTESLAQGFIEDPMIRIQRIAQEKFPNDPEAMRRFGIIGGDIVFVNEEGVLEKAQGGARDTAGSVAAFTPEVAGAVAGSFATGNPVLGSALGASAGRGIKEIIGGLFLDDPKTPVGVMTNMGIEFASDLLAGGVGKGAVMAKERKSLEGVTDIAFKSEARREQVKQATGIELDLAQVTNLPKLKALKLWARNFPGDAGEVIRANDEMIAGQVDEAVERLLNTISSADSTVASGVRGMNAAQAAITAARTSVADVTAPLYKQAFDAVDETGAPVKVDIDPVYDLIDEKLKTAKGGVATALREVRRYLNVQGSAQRDTSVRGLHGSKIAIDNLMEGDAKNSVARTAKREIAEVRAELLDQLSAASPQYDAARREFERQTSMLVDPLRDGVIGVLAKVPNQKAASAASKMFADGNVTPFEIRLAKKAILETEGGEQAWNGLTRQYLQNQFNRATREIQAGDEVNVAGKFRQLVIGTRQQKKAMLEALGPDAKELFDVTMEALQMVARTPTASSATAFNQMIGEELKGNVGSITRAVMQPRQSGIRAIEQNHLERMSNQIAEALTDRSKVDQLRILAKLPPSKEKALIASSVIGLSIIPRDVGGKILLPENDIIPPTLLEQGDE